MMQNENQRENSHADGPDLVTALAWVWRGRLLLAAVVAVCLAVALGWSITRPAVYSAEAKLLPRESGGRSGLLDQVAAFSGIETGGESSYEQLYGRILLSARLLRPAMERTWNHRDHGEPVSLATVLGVAADDATRLRERLRQDVLSFQREERTGYMVLRVSLPGDPQLAADLADFMVQQLEAFNQDLHARQATEQRGFVEGRLAEASAALGAAADELTTFITNNRAYESSPALLQRYGELQREVEAETSVWIELRRQAELAGIDENKRMVSINVLDAAEAPARPSSPRHAVHVAAGLVAGVVLGLTVLLLLETRRQLAARLRETAGA